MKNKYLIAKLFTIIFSLSTVVVFVLARNGMFLNMFGSTTAAVLVYAVNTLCLLVSIVLFLWFRAHKDMPKSDAARTLERYVDREDEGTK